jgi:hypothetical protein
MFDVIIAGSGPSAISALSGLPKSAKILILDVASLNGKQDGGPQKTEESRAYRDAQSLLGSEFEYLSDLRAEFPSHPKLRSPATKSVSTSGRVAHVFLQNGTEVARLNAAAIQGGFSRVWGAQLYRYSQGDLDNAGSWPILSSDLTQDYDYLEKLIIDLGYDLEINDFNGNRTLAANAQRLFERTRNPRSSLSAYMSRIAVSYPKYARENTNVVANLDFFRLHSDSVFTAKTLFEAEKVGRDVSVLGGLALEGWSEVGDSVKVFCKGIDGIKAELDARNLILACGTLETSALVLDHYNLQDAELPFLDHPPFLVPVFSPSTLLTKSPKHTFPIQFGLNLKAKPHELAATFYSPLGMLKSDLVSFFPLDLRLANASIPILLPSLGILQVWETSGNAKENKFRLRADGSIEIIYKAPKRSRNLKLLAKGLRRLGFVSFAFLTSKPVPGWGFHYVGTLPMSKNPQALQTHVDGRLWDSQRVYVVDGSALPSLPALNHSLTMMANARRIARGLEF